MEQLAPFWCTECPNCNDLPHFNRVKIDIQFKHLMQTTRLDAFGHLLDSLGITLVRMCTHRPGYKLNYHYIDPNGSMNRIFFQLPDSYILHEGQALYKKQEKKKDVYFQIVNNKIQRVRYPPPSYV